MEEIVPIIAGVVLAWLAFGLRNAALRAAVVLGVSFGVGFLWSWLIGELPRHWGFGLLDALQVLVSYAVIRWLFGRYRAWTGLSEH